MHIRTGEVALLSFARMRRSLDDVALDSNCLSYVIHALEGVDEPSNTLAEQKIALVRAFLYLPGMLGTLPTVKREFQKIPDPVWRAKHESWTNVHFGILPVNEEAEVVRRAALLREHHRGGRDEGEKDRLILAEAEDRGFSVLLSFDDRFVRNLAPHTRLNLTRPAPYWHSLAIPRGSRPRWEPTQDNPLSAQAWWRW